MLALPLLKPAVLQTPNMHGHRFMVIYGNLIIVCPLALFIYFLCLALKMH